MKILLHLIAVPLVVLAGAKAANKNELATRAFPRMQTMDLAYGCSMVLLTAEIKGPETEAWYCPLVEWEMPDGTTATEESDCAPFEKREECKEDQTGCGITGFYLDPVTGRYVDKRKECACTITGYPRIWRRRLCAPGRDDDKDWIVTVRLRKNGKTLAWQEIPFTVK